MLLLTFSFELSQNTLFVSSGWRWSQKRNSDSIQSAMEFKERGFESEKTTKRARLYTIFPPLLVYLVRTDDSVSVPMIPLETL
jgi:hypothetical protein